jgi:RNA polymerase sigma-70 factor, ECF subfamily
MTTGTRVTTRSNAEWVSTLKGDGPAQTAALTDLRALLLRAALFSLRRFRDSLGLLTPAEIHHLAEDCAQDAVLAILQHLEQFRGESRFTTWAYAFAINASLVAARRERWKRVPLAPLMDGRDLDTRPDGDIAADPDRRALQGETLAVIREVIDRDLSERQRQALQAIVFEGIPLDEVARHWGSNRNAVYKLLHDARRKLKARLEERGFGVRETLGLFEAGR